MARYNFAFLTALCVATVVRAEVDPDRLAGFKARSIGPAGMSGRIAALEALESNPQVVYAGAASGGVWKSTNGGLTWKALFDDQPVHAIGAIAVFQANPQILWVGTGEGNLRNSTSVGNGVYKSLDGGTTWSHVGLEKSERIYRLVLHPTNPDVALACVPGQEWGENTERGVYRTEDGGKNWKKALYVDAQTGCGELVVDPKNPNALLAGMWQFRRWPYFFKSGGPGSGIYRTLDGGTSWKRLQEEDGLPKGELGRVGIAFSRSNPEIAYALVEAEVSALLRSEDGGRKWKKVNERVNVAPRPFYFGDIRVDPAWPNQVYSLDYNVRVSSDSGKTFETLAGVGGGQIHGDHHAMWIDPNDPRHIYLGDDGGVAVSHDRGQTFRFVANLPLAQFYHVALDQERPYNVYGGLQDNGSWRGPSSLWQRGGIRNHHWLLLGGGDGFETSPNPSDAQQGYSLSQGGYLMRWDLRTGETKTVKPAPPDGVKLRFNWNAALSTDPFDAGTIYLGSQFVHRSTDRGETWSTISPDLTTNNPEWQKADESGGLTLDASDAEKYTTLVSIAPSALERGLIWTGSDDGRIHVTRDGGATWTAVEAGAKGVPANTWVPHIEPSSHAAGTAFAVFDNHRRSDWTPYVLRTDDYGKSWRSLRTSAVRGYALVLRQDPVQKDLLFLGTEFGLYVSWDEGGHWTQLKRTLPTASVMDLAIHRREHDLVIATHGRALWVLDDIRPLRALSEATLDKPLEFFPVADAQQHRQRREESGFSFGAGEFRGTNRSYGALLTYSLNVPGLPLWDDDKERERKEQARLERRATKSGQETQPAAKDAGDKSEDPKVEIQVTSAAGQTVRTFKAAAHLGINRAVWDLRADALKQAPRDADQDDADEDEDRGGPELPPGTYTLTLKYDTHEARQVVQVLADPRSSNTNSQWQQRWSAIGRAARLHDTAIDAVWRLRRTRDDVVLVQQKLKQNAQDAGEKDKRKLNELPLVKAGDELKQKLGALEKRLWIAPEVKGLPPSTDVLTAVDEALDRLQTSWDPPSPTQLEYLRQGHEQLAALVADANKLFETDVTAFRQQAADAKIGLLPPADPLGVKP